MVIIIIIENNLQCHSHTTNIIIVIITVGRKHHVIQYSHMLYNIYDNNNCYCTNNGNTNNDLIPPLGAICPMSSHTSLWFLFTLRIVSSYDFLRIALEFFKRLIFSDDNDNGIDNENDIDNTNRSF